MLPALQGESLRDRYLYQYFPHSPQVPDWLPPCVSVHHQEWKLIRIFHGGDNGNHRYLLFNLRDDLSEKINLADQFPDMVRTLDSKIEQFLKETAAVAPVPNPRFDPTQYDPSIEGKSQRKPSNLPSKIDSANANSIQNENDPVLKGWKVRNCRASLEAGILKLEDIKPNSFLGFAAGKHQGPTQVKFRLKTNVGPAHVDWLPGGAASTAQVVNYHSSTEQWQEITVDLPATTPLGIVRLYFPVNAREAQIDFIEIESASPPKISKSDF